MYEKTYIPTSNVIDNKRKAESWPIGRVLLVIVLLEMTFFSLPSSEVTTFYLALGESCDKKICFTARIIIRLKSVRSKKLAPLIPDSIATSRMEDA